MKYLHEVMLIPGSELYRNILEKELPTRSIHLVERYNGLEALKEIDSQKLKGRSYPVICADLSFRGLDIIDFAEQIGERVGKKEILLPALVTFGGKYPIQTSSRGHSHRIHYINPNSTVDLVRSIEREYERVIGER